MNASGGCLFGFLSTEIDWLPECISAVTGWEISLDELIKTGERIGAMRMLFTVREGINPLKLPFPDIALGKPALQAGPTKGITVDLDLLTKEFCEEMGWDIESGLPDKSKLAELGLDKIL
jgi:aldehyde:ferredoxin oxidoreductase